MTALPPRPAPTAPRGGLRLFFSQRGQSGCAPRPDWLGAAGLRAQAPRLVTKGGSPARAPAACGVSGARRRTPASLAMPNRRASRNAYYFFVQEKIPELRRRGLPVARVPDAIPYCSADWAVRRLGAGGRAVGQVGGRGGKERGLEGCGDPAAPAGGKGSPPVPALRRTDAEPPGKPRLPPRGPGAPRPPCCLSPFCPPKCPPKLLREEEKEKYAEMAREWRAAQGRDSWPSEKQVKLEKSGYLLGP